MFAVNHGFNQQQTDPVNGLCFIWWYCSGTILEVVLIIRQLPSTVLPELKSN